MDCRLFNNTQSVECVTEVGDERWWLIDREVVDMGDKFCFWRWTMR